MTTATGFNYQNAYRGETDEWYTPPHLFDALGLRFDLDPCAPPPGHRWTVPADRKLTHVEDGLMMPWSGSVFCNPPYGPQTERWLERMALHGDGIALVFARTSTRWFQRVGCSADLICLIRGRLHFIRSSDGEPSKTNAGADSMLLAWGERSGNLGSEGGPIVGLHTSIRNARSALRQPVDRFYLRCRCGWDCEETRSYVESRIRRHFAWADATASEIVRVAPVKTSRVK